MTRTADASAIGRSTPRRDAAAKVTGEARYPADLRETEVLHARVVFTGRPHARLLAMDARAAEAMAPEVARLMAGELGWDSSRQSAEVATFSLLAKQYQA